MLLSSSFARTTATLNDRSLERRATINRVRWKTNAGMRVMCVTSTIRVAIALHGNQISIGRSPLDPRRTERYIQRTIGVYAIEREETRQTSPTRGFYVTLYPCLSRRSLLSYSAVCAATNATYLRKRNFSGCDKKNVRANTINST